MAARANHEGERAGRSCPPSIISRPPPALPRKHCFGLPVVAFLTAFREKNLGRVIFLRRVERKKTLSDSVLLLIVNRRGGIEASTLTARAFDVD
jgi:hypothetical protein